MSDLISVKVVKKIQETENICSFELVREDGQGLPDFTAGAHINVHTPNGAIRQYSLCNDPRETDRYTIGILKEPESRGGSLSMVEQVEEGTKLSISFPRNHFPLANEAKRSLLFAGGIGITPILSMAESLASQPGADFEVHYCTRSLAHTAFRKWIKNSAFKSQFNFHFDDGGEAQKLAPEEILRNASQDDHIYVCGPQGFINWIVSAARSQGWAEKNIHREFFAAESIDTSDDRPFEVKIGSTGQVVMVGADESVIDALEREGVHIDFSCRDGVCGTCITGLLEGEVEHRDAVLTEEEHASNKEFTPCCSRSKSGSMLVLDL